MKKVLDRGVGGFHDRAARQARTGILRSPDQPRAEVLEEHRHAIERAILVWMVRVRVRQRVGEDFDDRVDLMVESRHAFGCLFESFLAVLARLDQIVKGRDRVASRVVAAEIVRTIIDCFRCS